MSAGAGTYTPATLVAASVRHMLRQRRPAIQRDSVGNVTCRYRTDDGLKCAIGGLIPEDFYRSGLECDSVTAVLSSAVPGCMKARPSILADLTVAAYCMQEAHDGWATDWKTGPATSADKAIEKLDKRVSGWREALTPDEVDAFAALISAPPSA